MTLDVAILAGGRSFEREISLRSGHRVADALGALGHDVRVLDVDPSLVRVLLDQPPDVVFLALHGTDGEDGTVQSLLDLVGIPYTGARGRASALAWDKALAQDAFARGGLAVPRSITLSKEAFRGFGGAAVLERVPATLGDELVVKPTQGGSSLGLTIVASPDELPRAVMHAFAYGDAALVEERLHGVEIAVSVLHGEPLPAVEIVPRSGDYDFGARYTAGATEFHAPARVADEVAERAASAARAAWDVLGVRHLARADFVIAEDTPYLLEVDTCPGLTETSLLPLAAQAAGITFGELCQRLVEVAHTEGST